MSEAQLLSVADNDFDRNLFDAKTLAALDLADAITVTNPNSEMVTDELFTQVSEHYSTEEIVVLTELIAWENASARFNRALGVTSDNIWRA